MLLLCHELQIDDPFGIGSFNAPELQPATKPPRPRSPGPGRPKSPSPGQSKTAVPPARPKSPAPGRPKSPAPGRPKSPTPPGRPKSPAGKAKSSVPPPRPSAPPSKSPTSFRSDNDMSVRTYRTGASDRNYSDFSSSRVRFFSLLLTFLPARRYASAGNGDRNVSVCLSVTCRYCVKRKKASGMISSPSGSPKTLVFWRQISSPNSNGFPPNGGLKQGSVGKIQRFFSFKRLYLENGSRYGQGYY